MDHQKDWTGVSQGTLVWISDEDEAFVPGEIKSVTGGTKVVVSLEGGKEVTVDTTKVGKPVKRGESEPIKILPRDASAFPVDNMDDLTPLNAASILENIRMRFRLDQIYTRTGPILIAMNPFKRMPQLYADTVMQRYKGKPYGDCPPHPYQESEDCVQRLQGLNESQCVVICGESGAGKTETTKIMLNYISKAFAKPGSAVASKSLGERMVDANPVLEAVGNAKTLRNNNSSRFGKFTMYAFDKDRRNITGGRVSNFLLEKARVSNQSQGERNYHIFYQLLAGAQDTWRTQMSLKEAESFFYLAQSGCISVDGMDDKEEFGLTIDSMKAVEIPDQEQFEIFKVFAGVLHLGNVTFIPDGDPDASRVKDMAVLTTASALLGINPQSFAQALVTNVRELPGNKVVVSPQNVHASEAARDGVAKHIFNSLFDEIVVKINRAFDKDPNAQASFIGVLDIFGFENLSPNGLDQLLINLANERLQKLFNDVTFKQELAIYNEEGIDFAKSDFPDNQQCLDLIIKKPSGILLNLDSACARGAAANDASFVSAGHKQQKGNPFYAACGRSTDWRNLDGSRTDENQFVIKHFAGPIIYTVGSTPDGKQHSSWVSKNLDRLYDHIYQELSTSNSEVMAELYPKVHKDHAHKVPTISSTFTQSLTDLIKTLTSASARFVRCIKSTPLKKPHIIDSSDVLRQLVCSGVIAALEVRNAGYPTRLDYAQFIRLYHVLTLGVDMTGKSTPKEVAAHMFTNEAVAPFVDKTKFKLGRTKVFMRAETGVLMSQMKRQLEDPFIRKIQKFILSQKGGIHQHQLNHTITRLHDILQMAEEAEILDLQIISEAVETAQDSVKLAKASSGLKFLFGIAVEKAMDDVAELCQMYEDVMGEKQRIAMARAAHVQKIDACRSRLERIAADSLKFEIPTGNLEQLWKDADDHLTTLRTKMEASFSGNDDAWAGMDEEEAEAMKTAEVEECAQLVRVVQTKFNACVEAQAELEHMRDHFSKELAVAVNKLNDLTKNLSDTSKSNEVVDRAMKHAKSSVTTAQSALEGHDVVLYETVVVSANHAIEDAKQCVEVEEFNFKEEQRRKEGYEIVQSAKRKYQEVGTLVDTNMLRSTPAIQIASGQCEDALSTMNSLESSGTADEFVAACEKFEQYVSYFNTTYHSEKQRVEQQRRERAAEIAKLQPAIEILHGLTTKLEVSTLPDESTVGHAIMEAAHECDVVKNYLDTTDNVAVARGRVNDAVKQVAAAERLFNDAVRRQNAINKELSVASKSLEVANRRLTSLIQNVEHAGSTVAQLVEERVAEAEAMIGDAKRSIRKGDQAGGLVAAVELALQRVEEAEEALVRTKQRVATVERARSRSATNLEACRQLFSEIFAIATETQMINIPSVSEALAVAESTMRVAEVRIEKPISAAWIVGGELSGDSNAVREAGIKVDEAEEKVYAEKRNLERMKRDVRSSESALSMATSKVEGLRQACSEFYLLADHEVSISMEEAEDALDHANKMVASFQPVDTVKHAITELVAKITAAEEKIGESRLRKDSGSKLWKDGQNHLDNVLTKLQGVVAMVDAVGPPVAALMEEVLFEATKAVNGATRLLRQGKDVTAFQAAVARAATMVDQADLAANKVRARVVHATKNMTGAMQRLDSLTRTLTLCLETADGKGVSRQPNVKQLLKSAEGMVQVARQRVEGGVQLWIDDPITASRLVDEAVEKVQLAEEGVDEAVQLKDSMDRQRERAQREIEVLAERFQTIRDNAAKSGVVSSSVPVQTVLSTAEKELDIARQALHAGNLVSFVPSSDALLDADRTVSLELRKTEKRLLDIEFAKLELPTLQRKLAAVVTMVDAAGPPVGVMVQADVMEAQKGVADIERLMSNGTNALNVLVLPALEEAVKRVNVAEQTAVMTIQKINKIQVDMANETHKLDQLQERFSSLCETVATFCSKSDHLRVQLEADWKDAVWWGSNENHAHTDGSPFGRNNIAAISTVQVIAESIGTAEAALVDARRRVEVSIENYMQSGPGTAARAIAIASEKLNQAQELVEVQNAKLEQEDRERSNAQARLETFMDRLSAMRALAEVNKVNSSPAVLESSRAAEHALDVVAQLLGAGNISASPAAMEVAMRKVCVVQEVILAEAQRIERVAAEKAHGAKMLQGVVRDFEAIKGTVEILGMKEVGFVGDALVKAERALKSAEIGLTNSDGSGIGIGKEVQKATQAVEDAERAVAQETAFQEELSRLKLKRSIAPQLQMIRDAQREGLKHSAEQWQRRKMHEELERAEALLYSSEKINHPGLMERVEAAEKSIEIAKQQLATGAIRSAQAATQHAIQRVKAATSLASDVTVVQEGLSLSMEMHS
jgi:myosin heavy subunit